ICPCCPRSAKSNCPPRLSRVDPFEPEPPIFGGSGSVVDGDPRRATAHAQVAIVAGRAHSYEKVVTRSVRRGMTPRHPPGRKASRAGCANQGESTSSAAIQKRIASPRRFRGWIVG